MFKNFILIFILLLSFNIYAQNNSEGLNNSEIYISVGKYKEALDILKGLEDLSIKENAKRDNLLGKLYFALGKYNKANEFFEMASLADSEKHEYLVGLAESYYALGKLKIAKSNAQFAIRADPDLIEAQLILAKIDATLGNENEAKNRFEELKTLQPSNEYIILNYAKLLESRSKISEAVKLIKDFIKKYPNTPYVTDFLGQLYWFLGDDQYSYKYRLIAIDLFKDQGKIINAKAIEEWIEKNYKNKKDENPEIKNKPKLPEKKKPRYILNSPKEIEPFPVKNNEYVGSGSGFIVNDGNNIVTNRHVIEGATRIYVRNGIGELREAKIEFISDTDDLAILSLNKKYNSDYSLEIPYYDNLKVGMDAIIMGYPLSSVLGDSSPSLTEGIVSKDSGLRDNPKTFILTSKLNKGNSGGPIFSSNGELIGVAVAKLNKTKILEESDFIPEDVNIGIKIERVKNILQPNNSIKVSNIKFDLSDLYEKKLASVVMVVSILPPPDQNNNNSVDDYTIEEAILDCQNKYSEEIELSKKQYDKFCICYIEGIAQEYNENEIEYEKKHGKISSVLEKKIDRIGKSCVKKVQ